MVGVGGGELYLGGIGMDKVKGCDFGGIGDYFNENSLLVGGGGYEEGLLYNVVEG